MKMENYDWQNFIDMKYKIAMYKTEEIANLFDRYCKIISLSPNEGKIIPLCYNNVKKKLPLYIMRH